MPNNASRTPGRETVLIVDDTPANIAVLVSLLQPLYRVRVANGGVRALAVAQSEPLPDLILLDIMMPDLNGYQVLEQLRELPATRDVAVVFVTALHHVEDEERGLAAGAADYITKPIQPSVVLARVRTQLDLKRARDMMRDQNAYLEAEVARRMSETLTVQEVAIRALARLAETRDIETGNHLLRTQSYVRLLAEHLRTHPQHGPSMTDAHIDLLAKSAPLHDIGKVGIPDSVLLKPGRLTAEERTVMETHAALGAAAIEQAEADTEQRIEFLSVAKDIARSHHERWDGGGYPDHLAGQNIPLSARLMAVADVFDALTTRRPYKEPMPFGQAVDLIIQGSGNHFDPAIVDAFLAKLPEFQAICERNQDNRAA
jgi:putative two-component system response regulator